MFAFVDFAAIADLADVGDVSQQESQRRLAELPSPTKFPGSGSPDFVPPTLAAQLMNDFSERIVL